MFVCLSMAAHVSYKERPKGVLLEPSQPLDTLVALSPS